MLSGPARIDRSDPIPALDLPEESFVEIAEVPSLEADRPFTVSMTFRFRKGGSRMILARQVDPDDDNRGWSLEIIGDRPSLNLQVKDGRNMGVRGFEENKLEPEQWHNVTVTYDGLRQRTGMSLYLDGAVVPTQSFGRAIRILEGSIRTGTPLVLGAGDRPSAGKSDFLNGSIRQFRILNRAVGESEARLLARWDTLAAVGKREPEALSPGDREALKAYFLVRRHDAFGQAARGVEIAPGRTPRNPAREQSDPRDAGEHRQRSHGSHPPPGDVRPAGRGGAAGHPGRPSRHGSGPPAEPAGTGPVAGV